jgi:hypothetical protein
MSHPALYIVEVTHNTGHGLCSNIALVTDRLGAALMIARRAEKLGYEFHTPLDSYVVINLVSPGVIYGERGDTDGRSPVVFVRRKTSSGWREEWYDERLKEAADE